MSLGTGPRRRGQRASPQGSRARPPRRRNAELSTANPEYKGRAPKQQQMQCQIRCVQSQTAWPNQWPPPGPCESGRGPTADSPARWRADPARKLGLRITRSWARPRDSAKTLDCYRRRPASPGDWSGERMPRDRPMSLGRCDRGSPHKSRASRSKSGTLDEGRQISCHPCPKRPRQRRPDFNRNLFSGGVAPSNVLHGLFGAVENGGPVDRLTSFQRSLPLRQLPPERCLIRDKSSAEVDDPGLLNNEQALIAGLGPARLLKLPACGSTADPLRLKPWVPARSPPTLRRLHSL